MQGTRVWALVWEDPTCHGATKPVCLNYWVCALEPASHNYWSPRATTTEAREPQLLKPARLDPMLHNKRRPRLAATRNKARAQQRRPNAAKNK